MQATNIVKTTHTSAAIAEASRQLETPQDSPPIVEQVEQQRASGASYPTATGTKALHQKLVSTVIQSKLMQEKSNLQDSQANMLALVQDALVAPSPGEQQQLLEHAWSTVHCFDAQRLAAGEGANSLHHFPELEKAAADTTHPSHQDAVLLKAIMTRPLGQSALSLEKYLADRVEEGLKIFMEIPPNPDSSTFNSVLPGLTMSTLDYNSVGRTLLFKGATHLVGIPSAPTNTDDQLSKAHVDRKASLRTTVFHFPKQPADGVKQLELLDFNNRIDPLDDLGVYELSDPRVS